MSDTTKLTVNVTDKAMTALEKAAERTGLSRTDTLNRALQLYAAVLDTEPGQALASDEPGVGPIALAMLPTTHAEELL